MLRLTLTAHWERCGLQRSVATLLFGLLTLVPSANPAVVSAAEGDKREISFYKDIRPLLQANCQGCHQPAKAEGSYVLTSAEQMFKAGDSGRPAIVPGDPAASYLIHEISVVDGKAEMPKNRPALKSFEIDLIRNWIAAGAIDDTPPSTLQRFDRDHPPVYFRAPVVTSLDFSASGELLAVAGFHEVLLWKADGSELVARLVGLSERIEAVKFSPDGTRLLVTGGRPARLGEIQIWNVANRSLELSIPITADTIYGGSWSPDGTKVAIGGADNSVRAFDAQTGEQVVFQGAHEDWVRQTVFSTTGSHLVSVGRDMTAKLTEVATQRFIDNLTSITPNALKGGLTTVDRHPQRDEIVVGGSDGEVKVYRMFRVTGRVIGDDGNLIRKMPAMLGRIWSVAVSRDGLRIAAASGLDGAGEVSIFNYDFDTSLPENIRQINSKTDRNPEERQALADYHVAGVKQLAKLSLPQATMYAVAFSADSATLAAAGADGQIRLIDVATGVIRKEFPAVTLSTDPMLEARDFVLKLPPDEHGDSERAAPVSGLQQLVVEPREIVLSGPFDYCQPIVMGHYADGSQIDLTRFATIRPKSAFVEVSETGTVYPRAAGITALDVQWAGQSVQVPVRIAELSDRHVDFVQDVNPVLSRLGCNQGTCHGAAKGKNGFKLSLRGYDPIFDLRGFTDDLASRRTNMASAGDSLMLLKATGSVPHVGGQLTRQGEPYYEIIRHWIAQGAQLNLDVPRVVGIDLFPRNPIVQQPGQKQQFRVLATYANGRVRDVTREAFVETGNGEVATANKTGLLTAVRRGEAPILARFEGNYVATTMTVMGDRDGFVWTQPPANNRIDELVADKWQRLKIVPSGLCTDAEFLRRVSLDLTGLPPTAAEVRAFLADSRDTRIKRDEVIDRLIGSEAYIDHWTNKWADLLMVNRKFLGAEGANAYRQWIRQQIAGNTPYDQFAREILTSTGSNKEHPQAGYFKILRTPQDTMENTTHLFLGIRFNCNKCHDHPFERWTQDQYYQTAAYFAQVGLERDPAGGDQYLGGTAVEGAKPLYEIVRDLPGGEVKHERTNQVTPPKFPFDCQFSAPGDAPRRSQLAAWLSSPDNPYFAKSLTNRVWGYLLGVGIMEPLDDLRAGNPPTNPELLEFLTKEFVQSGFNVRHIQRLICQSRTYQLAIETNAYNVDDRTNFSHALARRLPAEVLLDTIYAVTGFQSQIPGVPAGTRAAALPDSGVELPSGFLSTFGRPVRESTCECERSGEMSLGPVMALISGPTVNDAVDSPSNAIAQLVATVSDDQRLVDEIFVRVLGRSPTDNEQQTSLALLGQLDGDHTRLAALLQQRQDYVAVERPRQEAAQQATILQAQQELAAYEAAIAGPRAEMEQKRLAKIAELEAELVQYVDTTIRAQVPDFESKTTSAGWEFLEPQELVASTGAKLTVMPDRSVLAEFKPDFVTYTLSAQVSTGTIGSIRLEALSDPQLPGQGPGLSPSNGNFVLTEFTVQRQGADGQLQPVALHNAKADFSQNGFDIATAIDGQTPNANNGWAIYPQQGRTHWATFELKEPIDAAGGVKLVFTLDHRYTDKVHPLGKFRLSVSPATTPGLSVPAEIEGVVAVPVDQRDDAQRAKLLDFLAHRDEGYRQRQAAIGVARQPLPPDPQLMALQGRITELQKPLPPDARLEQLKKDAELSARQLSERRLTVAQDLTWALINSPAFLFNR